MLSTMKHMTVSTQLISDEGWQATVGKFYDLIDQHMGTQDYPPSERKLAKRLGVSPSTLDNWRTPKKLIAKRHIVAVARLAGVRYATALDALLDDIGYLYEETPEPAEESGDAAAR